MSCPAPGRSIAGFVLSVRLTMVDCPLPHSPASIIIEAAEGFIISASSGVTTMLPVSGSAGNEVLSSGFPSAVASAVAMGLDGTRTPTVFLPRNTRGSEGADGSRNVNGPGRFLRSMSNARLSILAYPAAWLMLAHTIDRFVLSGFMPLMRHSCSIAFWFRASQP